MSSPIFDAARPLAILTAIHTEIIRMGTNKC